MPKEHLLVVEDEEDILELLRYNPAKEGYRVTGALSGEEVLRPARVSDFTAFFCLGRIVEFGATQQLFTNPANKPTEGSITGRFG